MDIINIDNYLRINLVDMAFVLFSTFLIVLIAKKFFWKYAKAYLDGRVAYIQGELDESNKNLAESEILKAQYETRIASAHQEAGEILTTAKQRATQEAGDIVAQARNNAQMMKEKAFDDIAQEKANVRNQMKEEMSEIAFLAAKQVVKKELDEKTHKQYVKDFIDQAEEDETWQA